MEYKVLSSDGETEYTVDTEKVTCTCPQFMYRCSHKPIDSEDRLCKHIAKVFEEHPESVPTRLQHEYAQADMSGKDPDGKVRYPRGLFDLYVSSIKSTLAQFNQIVSKFEVCGSYRRLASRVSDLDILIQLDSTLIIDIWESTEPDHNDNYIKCINASGSEAQKIMDELDPDHIALRPKLLMNPNDQYNIAIKRVYANWDPLLDYMENVLGYKLIQEIGRGSAKAAYMIDGFVHVDFMCIEPKSWPFALLHFTGSKSTNIEMRRRANQMGYTLNQYGLIADDGSEVAGLTTEKDIFEFLQLQFKQPWDR